MLCLIVQWGPVEPVNVPYIVCQGPSGIHTKPTGSSQKLT